MDRTSENGTDWVSAGQNAGFGAGLGKVSADER